MLERTVGNIENILNIVDGVADCHFDMLLMMVMMMMALMIDIH